MIPSPQTPRQQAPRWQHVLRDSFTDPAELLDYLELPRSLPALDFERVRAFPMRVPRGFAARMHRGDPNDPLFRQVWPAPEEAETAPGYSFDAVGDLKKLRDGGLIHKYHGRILLVATGACAVNCRYCFRRHFPYSDHLAARDHWRQALATIAADPSIREVILSGGDPLSLSDDKLSEFSAALEAIPHVQRLRLHTRQPVVVPERIDDRFLAWIARGRLQKIVVLHINHAQELDEAVSQAASELRRLGIILLNQSVLLRGVNDDVESLLQLSERLSESGILPYYLHLLDRVQGATHFEVSEQEAHRLHLGLSASLPGYLVPRLVREESGATSKTSIAW